MEYNPYSPVFIKNILSREKLHLSKDRGQNYLIDRNSAEKIAEAACLSGNGNMPFFEVGSGLGSLTILLAGTRKTYSLEIDNGISRLFGRLYQNNNLILLNNDFLKYDFSGIPEKELFFVSNLPYSISGEAIRKFIDSDRLQAGIVMLQKEFADRMIAEPGKEGYGVFSILSQYYLEIYILFEIGRNNFFPAPSIDSSVIKIIKRRKPIPQKELNSFLRKAFQSRRKTIINNLKNLGFDSGKLNEIGVDPGLRPEEIAREKWIDLFNYHKKILGS